MKNKILFLFGLILFFNSCKNSCEFNEYYEQYLNYYKNDSLSKLMIKKYLFEYMCKQIRDPNSKEFIICESAQRGRALYNRGIVYDVNANKYYYFKLNSNLEYISDTEYSSSNYLKEIVNLFKEDFIKYKNKALSFNYEAIHDSYFIRVTYIKHLKGQNLNINGVDFIYVPGNSIFGTSLK